MGTVDGPGVRFVVFMQGCPLRCAYCHNPDTWEFDTKETIYAEAEEVFAKIKRCRPYFGKEGGVTVSGEKCFCSQSLSQSFLSCAKRKTFPPVLTPADVFSMKRF